MRDEGQGFEIGLDTGIVAKVVHARDLDIHGHEIAAGGKHAGVQIGGAIHALQSTGVFAAAILKQMNPAHVGSRSWRRWRGRSALPRRRYDAQSPPKWPERRHSRPQSRADFFAVRRRWARAAASRAPVPPHRWLLSARRCRRLVTTVPVCGPVCTASNTRVVGRS